MKTKSALRFSCIAFAAAGLLNPSLPAQDGLPGGGNANPIPVVSMELIDPSAAETLIDQNAIFWAEFRVRRTGDLTKELTVHLNTRQGTATRGEDYRLDRVGDDSTVHFSAGAESVSVRLYPVDDSIYEGDETVFLHLIAPPAGDPASTPYNIDLAHSSVEMVIHDNDPVTTRLEITAPHQDQHFEAGETIELRAKIIGPGSSETWVVEFLDDTQRIGSTQLDGTIWWSNAIGGSHTINARAYKPTANPAAGEILVAEPVTISVGPGPALPVVSLGVQGRGKTMEPCPACFVPAAVFIVSRTGPVTAPLTVYLEYDGPATFGVDYRELPRQVTIPAGRSSIEHLLLAVDDLLVEGPEIARATIVSPELATLGYVVSHVASQAMLVIDDDEAGSPDIRLDIVSPADGARFSGDSSIEVSALAVWRQGEVDRPVKFFAGDTLIGQTNPPQLGRPTIPCLPSAHTILWINPEPGEHLLTAQFEVSPGLMVKSPPIRLMVGVVDPPPWPVITIEPSPLENPRAPEFCPPNADCAYPSFVIRHSGPTADAFRVWLRYSGTATSGSDYDALPFHIDIPAGQNHVLLTPHPTDDLLAEGPETIIAQINPPPTSPDSRPYVIDPNHDRATITIVDNDQPIHPTVFVSAEDEIAQEISILAVIDEVRFRVHRTGSDLTQDLTVFYSLHGSAMAGTDYRELPGSVRIPAGAASADIHVFPVYDQNAEGMETVMIQLEPSPAASPVPAYEVSPAGDDAVGIILDGPGLAEPDVEIIRPEEGDHFTHPGSIEILAAAYHPTRDVLNLDFFSGSTKIGESNLVFDRSVTGGLILHRFKWEQPAPGNHTLTAVGYDTEFTLVATSPPVHITVDSAPPRPVVRIEATSRIAEESSEPFRRIPFRGEFTISRTGPTADPLSLWLHVSGSATPGVDYPALGLGVDIPAGAASIKLEIVPENDHAIEGIETVVVMPSQCPPETDPPLGAPCFLNFETDPAADRATVFIRDDGLTQASLAITNPKEGTSFSTGDLITIDAVAIDLESYISRVEFWDGDARIGESELVFIQAPPPGTPIYHSFEWRGAVSGSHTLTARTLFADGTGLSSQPVHITVGPVAGQVVLEVVASDPAGTEPGGNGMFDPAEFTVRRIGGPQNVAVPVYYSMDGTAKNGADYSELRGSVLLPANAGSVKVAVSPLPDAEFEGDETVIMRLEPPVCIVPANFPPPPECYVVGPHGTAQAIIRDGEPNAMPHATITAPVNGAEFPADAPVEIVVRAQDPDGYVRKVEFFADDRKIGEAAIDFIRAPEPGQVQTFTFVWNHPTPGDHMLVARVTDDNGASSSSAPVGIKVGDAEQLPIVIVTAPDPLAVEPGADASLNTAAFRIRRFGPQTSALAVAYSLRGSAQNGIDYEMLSGLATIPAGHGSVRVFVRPSADGLVEGTETVMLQIEPPPPAVPGAPPVGPYRPGGSNLAVAVIDDHLVPAAAAGVECVPLGGGLMEVCFPAEAGHNFRIEATSDLRNWETLFDAVAADGMWHFIDADMPNHRQRFYRLTPEPVVEIDD